MAIHLGYNNGTKVGAIFKCSTLSFSSLTNTGIQYEDSHIWVDSLPNLHHLLKQLRLLLVPTRGINYDNIETLFLELGNTLSGY